MPKILLKKFFSCLDPNKIYRLISFLPAVFKIIEKSKYYRLKILKRITYSTNTFPVDLCQAQLTNFVLAGKDKGMFTDIILTDLQQVFQKLDHKRLLEKMTCLGFNTSVITWLEFY